MANQYQIVIEAIINKANIEKQLADVQKTISQVSKSGTGGKLDLGLDLSDRELQNLKDKWTNVITSFKNTTPPEVFAKMTPQINAARNAIQDFGIEGSGVLRSDATLALDNMKVGFGKLGYEVKMSAKEMQNMRDTWTNTITKLETTKPEVAKNISAEINAAKASIAQFGVATNVSASDVKLSLGNMSTAAIKAEYAIKSLNQTVKSSGGKKVDPFGMNLDSKELENIKTRWKNTVANIENTKPKVFAAITNEVKALNAAIADYGVTGKISRSDVATEFSNVNTAAKKAAAGFKATTEDGMGFNAMLETGVLKMAIWAIAGTMLYGTLREIQRGIQFVKDLNKELTNISVVTGATQAETAKLALQYNTLAKELGSTTLEVTRGSLEFLKQGKSAAETTELLRASTMMSKLANMDSAKSTEALTATLNGYKLEAKDAISVLDVLVNLDNNYATSVEEISSAMQRSSSVAKQASVDYKDLAAYITVISSVTRLESESIGQALKTIFTRMEQVKLGKKLDEEGEDISNVEKALRTQGIEVRKNATEFRDMDDVLSDVAAKYKELGATGRTVEQGMLVQTMAGVRQGNMLTALFENWDMVTKAQDIASKSSGIASKRYEEYMKGIEAATNRFTSAWEQLWTQAISSGLIKFIIDMGAGILELTHNVGGFIPVLVAITGAILALKAVQIAVWLEAAIRGLGGLKVALLAVQAAMVGTAGATALATAGLSLLAAAILYMGYQLFFVRDAAEQYADALNKVNETTNKITQGRDAIASLNDLSKQFDELSKKQLRSSDEATKWYDVQNQIKELIPEINGYYDEQGNFIVAEGVALEKLIDLKKIQLEIDREQFAVDNKKLMAAKKREYDEAFKKLGELTASRRGMGRNILTLGSSEEISNAAREVRSLRVELDMLGVDMGSLHDGLSSSALSFIELTDAASTWNYTDDDVRKNVSTTREVFEALTKAADDSADSLMSSNDQLKSILSDYDEYGQITLSQANSMIEMGYAAALSIDTETGAISLNKEQLRQLVILKAQVAVLDAQLAYNYAMDTSTINGKTVATEIETKALWASYQVKLAILNLLSKTPEAITIPTPPPLVTPTSPGGGGGSGVNKAEQEYQKLLDETIKKIKQKKEAEKDALNDALDGYKAIIDAAKDALDAKKDERDYNKSVSEQSKNITRIQNELTELQFDTSSEATARKLELQDELSQAQGDLEDDQYDRSIDVQKEALDKEYDAYKAIIDKKIKAIEKYLADEDRITQEATKKVGKYNADMYGGMGGAAQQYGSTVATTLANGATAAVNYANIIGSSISGAWNTANAAMTKYYEGLKSYSVQNPSGNVGGIFHPAYHDGGIVNGIPTGKAGEVYAKLMQGEFVSTNAQMSNFIGRTLPELVGVSGGNGGGNNISMEFNVAGNLDRSVIPEIRAIVLDSVNKAISTRGIVRNAKSYSI